MAAKFIDGAHCWTHGVVRRYVSNNMCEQCRKEMTARAKARRGSDKAYRDAANAYAREWKKEHYQQSPVFRKILAVRTAEWRKSNPEKVVAAKLRLFSLTAESYDELLAKQGGVCRICNNADPGGGRKKFFIDHDHSCCSGRKSCGICVRGLLCMQCNYGLGHFRDSSAFLLNAAAYIDTWKFL